MACVAHVGICDARRVGYVCVACVAHVGVCVGVNPTVDSKPEKLNLHHQTCARRLVAYPTGKQAPQNTASKFNTSVYQVPSRDSAESLNYLPRKMY
jgi:hypothetical protein